MLNFYTKIFFLFLFPIFSEVELNPKLSSIVSGGFGITIAFSAFFYDVVFLAQCKFVRWSL